jgi:hypothetical protein
MRVLRGRLLERELQRQREERARLKGEHRQQTLAVSTHAQKVKILQEDYARLSKIYGANSEQAINAETKVLQAQQASARGGRAAHAAAGAGRLSDQQKLDNSLLADQERFDQQSEQAEREHGKRLVEIEAEYERKSLEQQRANEVSRFPSRAVTCRRPA